MQDIQSQKPHTLTLDNRDKLTLTGVSDVPGFDEQTVNVLTSQGTLIIKGESLHISRLSLDTGEVSVDGRINSMQYLGDNRSKGLVSKLFK
ncbi:MAG: sporulation protein YabP [Clostridia bacterium]|nr:sporulation protein YabP [Clostridia bacterium]